MLWPTGRRGSKAVTPERRLSDACRLEGGAPGLGLLRLPRRERGVQRMAYPRRFMDSGLLTIRDRHNRTFWRAAATNHLKPRPKFAVLDGTTGFALGHLSAAALDSATSLLLAPALRPRENAVAAARVGPGFDAIAPLCRRTPWQSGMGSFHRTENGSGNFTSG